MKPSLPLRLSIPLSLATLAVALTGIAFLHDRWASRQAVEQSSAMRARALVDVMGPELAADLARGDQAGAQATLARLRQVPNLALVAVVDQQGRALLTNHETAAATLAADPARLGVLAKALARGHAELAVSGDRQRIDAAIPLPPPPAGPSPARTWLLYTATDLIAPQHKAMALNLERSVVMALAAMIACLAVWAYLHLSFSRRVGQLLASVSTYSAATPALQAPADGGDELALIGRAINQMVADLSTQNAALRASEAQLRTIIDTEPECVKLLGPGGTLLAMNLAGLRMIEAESFAEIAGKSAYGLVAEAHREGFRQLTEEVLAGGSGAFEFEIVGLRGGHRWLETHAAPLRDAAGRVTALLGVTRDITAHRRTQDLLDGQRQVLERIATGAPLGESLDALCRLVERQAPGMVASVLLLDEDGLHLRHGAGPSLPAAYTSALDGTAIGPAVGSCGTAAWRQSPVFVTDIASDPLWQDYKDLALGHGLHACWSTPIFDREHQVLGTFALYYGEPRRPDLAHLNLIDMATHTAAIAISRAHAESRLQASEERYREIAETIQEVFWIASADRQRLLYVSPAFEKVWGRPHRDLTTATELAVAAIHPEDRERVGAAKASEPAASGSELEFRILRPDGSVRWLHDRVFPVRDGDGQLVRVIGVTSDVTDHHEAQEQLRQSQRLESIGKLAAGIAHDFNNLLTVVNSVAELRLEGLADSDPLHADLELIRSAGAKATDLTAKLLAFARRQRLQPEIIDLNSVVRDATSLLRRVIGENIQVVTHLAAALPPCSLDPGQFHQVLLNLAVNARDAMPGGGTLTIETTALPSGSPADTALPGQLQLTVRDTGHGMDRETLQRVFEPFFTTKGPGRGTGLGLATVHGIVSQSGGNIRVDSAIGEGTTFTIVLPAAEPAARERRPITTVASPTAGECVLVVDDDGDVRDLTARILERAGYHVLVAGNATEALQLLETHQGPLDLLLSDVVMPGMSGPQLAQRVRAIRPSIHVIFMSGYADGAVLRHQPFNVPFRFLGKPYSTAELTELVRHALRS